MISKARPLDPVLLSRVRTGSGRRRPRAATVERPMSGRHSRVDIGRGISRIPGVAKRTDIVVGWVVRRWLGPRVGAGFLGRFVGGPGFPGITINHAYSCDSARGARATRQFFTPLIGCARFILEPLPATGRWGWYVIDRRQVSVERSTTSERMAPRMNRIIVIGRNISARRSGGKSLVV